MTRFAEPLLLETPCCQAKVMQKRFASINSFGISSRWSDGYSWMPLVSEMSRLAYCPGCNQTYWLEDATRLGMVPSFDKKSTSRSGWLRRIFWKSHGTPCQDSVAQITRQDLFPPGYHKSPRPADLLLAVLREEWSSTERELYLRTRLWWLGNHGQRGQRTVSPMNDAQAEANMLRLLVLHQAAPVSDQDAETIAELFRQMGRFDEAITALKGRRDASATAAAIEDAAASEKIQVFQVETF